MPDIRQSGIIDDFERPDEDPLQFPWVRYGTASGHLKIGDGFNHGVVVSNTFPSDTPRAYLSTRVLTGSCEIWGNPMGSAALQDGWEIGLNLDPGGSRHGYELVMWDTSSDDVWDLRRVNNSSGGFTLLQSVGSMPTVQGHLCLMRITPDRVRTYYATDLAATTWIMVNDVADTTYRGAFFPTIGVTGVETGWGAVGGGVINRSQFIRWTRTRHDP